MKHPQSYYENLRKKYLLEYVAVYGWRCECCQEPKEEGKLTCHELFRGTGYRKKSIEKHYVAMLCEKCHNEVTSKEGWLEKNKNLFMRKFHCDYYTVRQEL